jgi:hypothetical protein
MDVFALDVLDELELNDFEILERADDDRHIEITGGGGSGESAVSENELEAVAVHLGPYGERLKNAAFLDACGQFL